MGKSDDKRSKLNGVMMADAAQLGMVSSQKNENTASVTHYGDWLLILWSALLWGGLIENANRTLLPTYGLSVGGAKVAEVPLIVLGMWSLFWLLVWWVAGFSKPAQAKEASQEGTTKRFSVSFAAPRWRAFGLGTIGAFGLLFISGSGALGLLLAAVVAAGFVMAHHVLSSIAPQGSGRLRVRLLLTTMALGMMAMIYFQLLGLLTWIGR